MSLDTNVYDFRNVVKGVRCFSELPETLKESKGFMEKLVELHYDALKYHVYFNLKEAPGRQELIETLREESKVFLEVIKSAISLTERRQATMINGQLSIFQAKYKRWYAKPGNPGYQRCVTELFPA
jgi:hypothetical protein